MSQDLQMIFFLLELLTEAVLFLKREGLGWGKKKLFAKKKKKTKIISSGKDNNIPYLKCFTCTSCKKKN